MYGWIAIGVVALLIVLDLARVLRLIAPLWMAIYLPVAINIPLLFYLDIYLITSSGPVAGLLNAGIPARIPALVILSVEIFYIWIHLNVFPIMDRKKAGFRLKAMMGAGPLLYAHIYAVIAQLVFLIIAYPQLYAMISNHWILIANAIYSAGCCFFLFLNGILRAFIASSRLRLLRRVLLFLTLWIPVVNWIMWASSIRLLRQEYDFGVEKQLLNATRTESDLCKTRYPLLMLHGVAFRDMRYFNYWGRIPRHLKRYGAEIYYGNQEAFGTIAYNGQDIRDRIDAILRETGSEKVNIIAHSKGGLDARYAISAFGLGDKVASLTTMNTPHRGCKFADRATQRIKENHYRLLARLFDNTFRKYGDKNPDFYTTTREFCTEPGKAFNARYADVPGVYYQSYTSVMKKMSSDFLLCIPYFFIRKLGEENDGLVSVESAQWGAFKGVFRNTRKRGISHGDIIDLKREDYKGFDVTEAYIGIVSDLKKMGF
jgi:triacylglycerol lipase